MSDVELLRLTLYPRDEIGSALWAWGILFEGHEPLSFETDEDGDTFATGHVDDAWIEIVRQSTKIVLTVAPRDPSLFNMAPSTFDDPSQAYAAMLDVGGRAFARLSASSLELTWFAARMFETAEEAMASLRAALPNVHFPESAREAQFHVTSHPTLKPDGKSKASLIVQWRTGRRAFHDEKGEHSRAIDSQGTIVTVRVKVPLEVGEGFRYGEVVQDMMSLVRQPLERGIDAL